MLKINLLEKTLTNDREVYTATDKGLDFLQRYREITELLKKDEDNDFKNGVKAPPPHLLKKN
jgi:DNA-binding PadR family transcriptional regulator